MRMRLIFAILATLTVFAPAARAEDSLYQAFGEKPGLVKLVDVFVDKMLADPRIKQTFEEKNIRRIRTQLVEQFCQLTGGPCDYKGRDMAESHAKLGIDTAQFNVAVEALQEAMNQLDIPNGAQNRLLALLAPMQRTIVTH